MTTDRELVTNCLHCWHGNGQALLTQPAQYPERCCWCGEKRVRHESVVPMDRHGPFVMRLADESVADDGGSV